MMSADELLEAISARGGIVRLEGRRIRYDLAGDAAPLVAELLARREEVRELLQKRASVPPIPLGFRLLSWKLKPAPVLIETVSAVADPAAFAVETFQQLASAKADPVWRWVIPMLLDRLAQIGVVLTDKQEVQEVQSKQENQRNAERY